MTVSKSAARRSVPALSMAAVLVSSAGLSATAPYVTYEQCREDVKRQDQEWHKAYTEQGQCWSENKCRNPGTDPKFDQWANQIRVARANCDTLRRNEQQAKSAHQTPQATAPSRQPSLPDHPGLASQPPASTTAPLASRARNTEEQRTEAFRHADELVKKDLQAGEHLTPSQFAAQLEQSIEKAKREGAERQALALAAKKEQDEYIQLRIKLASENPYVQRAIKEYQLWDSIADKAAAYGTSPAFALINRNAGKLIEAAQILAQYGDYRFNDGAFKAAQEAHQQKELNLEMVRLLDEVEAIGRQFPEPDTTRLPPRPPHTLNEEFADKNRAIIEAAKKNLDKSKYPSLVRPDEK